MRKDCDTCLHDEFCETYCNDCYWANGKPPTKWEPAPFWTPDTNADRIRAMSDEELATQLVQVFKEGIKVLTDMDMPEELLDKFWKSFLERLKQPADMRGEEDG